MVLEVSWPISQISTMPMRMRSVKEVRSSYLNIIPLFIPLYPPLYFTELPHICPEDESLGEESDKKADQQPRIPSGFSRLHRQHPSRQGRVAYVIYGGIIDTESGVYYNWYVVPQRFLIVDVQTPCRPSCRAVILRYCKNSALPYVGFNAEVEATALFKAFQTSGQLPPGIFFPASLQLLDGSPVPQQPTPTAKHCDRPPPSSHTTISPSPNTL